MKKNNTIVIILALFFSFGCASTEKRSADKAAAGTTIAVAGPDAIIYKTRADYHELVPVIMNAAKDDIVSFPAPGDLKYKGRPALPTDLADGFLLDNRGINENSAFLGITYEDYMALEKTPSKDELLGMIIDRDPFTVMYDCGKRGQYRNEVDELNALIRAGDFSRFSKLR